MKYESFLNIRSSIIPVQQTYFRCLYLILSFIRKWLELCKYEKYWKLSVTTNRKPLLKNGEWSWNNAIRMAKCPNMYNGALLTC